MTSIPPGSWFGEPWPSGLCQTGRRVATPAGDVCAFCDTVIEPDDQGSFVYTADGTPHGIHKECGLRSVVGGIGHLEDHSFWCEQMHDPNGGRSSRQSALEVWEWCLEHPSG